MKSIVNTILVVLFVLILFACGNSKTIENAATIQYEQATESEKDFLFSTMGGNFFVLVDSKAAIKVNESFQEETHQTLSELGIANAFALTFNEKNMLCTAVHATQGLEDYTTKLGADIALLDYLAMPLNGSVGKLIDISKTYTLGKPKNNDSLFIRGYLFDKSGALKSVTVKGVGQVTSNNEFTQGIPVQGEKEFLQDRFIIMPLSENIDLGGLSGSPAFNSIGEVVGVYSGRMIEHASGEPDKYYLRISLF